MPNPTRGFGLPSIVLAMALAIAAGCSDASAPSQNGVGDPGDSRFRDKGSSVNGVSTVTVTIDQASIATGATATAKAVAKDNHGNIVSGVVATWQSSNQAAATVSSAGIVTAVAPGSANIRATINNVSGSVPVTVVAPTPTVGSVATVSVTLDSTTLTVPNVSQARATLRDSSGNMISGTVQWSSRNTAVATVSTDGAVRAVTAGSAQIVGTAADGAHGVATLTVNSTVTATTVGAVAVTLGSSSIAIGATTQATAKVYDTNGNLLTGKTVSWTTSNGSVVGVNASTGVVNGIAAGSASIVATVGNAYGSAPVTIVTGPSTQVALSVQPANSVSGSNLGTQPVVQIRDASGTVSTSSTASVTATLNGSGATLSGTTTVNAVNGAASFTNLRVNGSGAHTITFASSGLTPMTSSSFTVTQTASSLSLGTQPGGAVTGAALSVQPVVRVLDAAGMVDVAFTGQVAASLTSVSGTGTLGGTTTVTAAAGVATFTNLAITGAGTFTLKFQTSSPVLQVSSNQLNVTSVVQIPTQLAIASQPSTTATSGTAFSQQPSVQLRDASNQPVSQSGVAVTASIASGTGTLGGTTTATTNASGVATFSNLSLSSSTTSSFTLSFKGTGLASATSGAISVAVVSQPPSGTFSTPNILNNASFENSWSGFTDWASQTPSGSGLSLDNTAAYDGSWSIRRTWSPNPGGDVGAQLAYNLGSVDHIWIRFYFKLTAPITSIMKFMRFYAPGWGTAEGGLFLGSGGDIFTFGGDAENYAITTTIGLSQSQVIDGRWHSLEVEYWRNGDPSGWPSAAFWFDGNAQALPNGTANIQYSCASTSSSTCSKAYWQNGRLYSGVRATSSPLGVMEWIATLNAGNTTTGQINLDRIAISTTGRIGP